MESERGPVSGRMRTRWRGSQETRQFAAQTPKPGTTVARVARRYDVKRIAGLAFREESPGRGIPSPSTARSRFRPC